MKITRRGFVQTATAVTAAGLAGCKTLERGYPEEYEVKKPPVPGSAKFAPGDESLVRSTCQQCPGGCGIVVRVVEGRAVKISGNPDFPTNQGGLCPKGLNGLQVLYDPDRIEGPLERTGERGAGGWRKVSWDAALARVTEALGALRRRGVPQAAAFLAGRYRGHMRDLVSRFMTVYGSPNDLDHESLSVAGRSAYALAQGVDESLAYDWERTRYVLSFGAAFVESLRPTAMMLRIFGHLHQGTPGARTKIVQIDPRQGVSSSRADEWVQAHPSTDGALALGLAHVLVRDGLVDTAFVREHTLGFEAWTDPAGRRHQGFKDLLGGYAPKTVTAITGVPIATIERLAHEFGEHRPAVAIAGRGAAGHTNGLYNMLAIHALNALVGSIDVPGGVIVQRPPPFAALPTPELDETARRGRAQPRVDLADLDQETPLMAKSRMTGLATRIEQGQPYPVEALFFYYTNPLFSAPSPRDLRAALAKVPLLVSFSPFLDETSAMCDLVLPDHTYLERWQLDATPPSVGYPLFSVRQPVVEPLHDTRSTGEVLVQLAHRLGGVVDRAFPATELDFMKEAVRGVQASGRGSVADPDFNKFWDKLTAAGGWWDPPYRFGEWDKVLATPSKKYEFYCTKLDERIGAAARAASGQDTDEARAAVLARLGVRARGDEACLPHHEPMHAADPGLPFVLTSYKTMTHAEGRGGNQPHLQELFGVQFDRSWEPWVEIHPDDARALSIVDDDEVVLSSPRGEVRLKAVLSSGAHRGVVSVPVEYGHTAYGRWAVGRSQSLNLLVPGTEDRLVGQVAWYDARVDVRKA